MKNVYIVTGASRGLGNSIVKELAKEENVIFCISRIPNIENEKISNARYFQCDLSDTDKLPIIINSIFRGIDFQGIESATLINNAGVLSPIKSIHNATVKEISNNIDINLKALVILTSLFIQKTQKMNIKKMVINISSGAAVKPYDGWSVYCATKAGVDMFTRCVALEQARQEFPAIIFSFYPSIMDTGMQELIRKSDIKDFPDRQRFVRYKENRELLSAEFVAKTLLNFIISDNIENGGIYDIKNIL